MQIALEVLGAVVLITIILLGVRWAAKNVKIKTERDQ